MLFNKEKHESIDIIFCARRDLQYRKTIKFSTVTVTPLCGGDYFPPTARPQEFSSLHHNSIMRIGTVPKNKNTPTTSTQIYTLTPIVYGSAWQMRVRETHVVEVGFELKRAQYR